MTNTSSQDKDVYYPHKYTTGLELSVLRYLVVN
jgi:hypothetical protein